MYVVGLFVFGIYAFLHEGDYSIEDFAALLQSIFEPVSVLYTWPVFLPFFVAQGLLLWPIRKPMPHLDGRSRSVWSSLVAFGFILSVMLGILVIAGVDIIWILFEWMDLDLEAYFYLVIPGLAAGWFFWTLILFLVVSNSKGSREVFLIRWLRLILAGSVIEFALVLPIDVMVRRKDDCWCATGSFWGMLFAAFIALWTMGPLCLLLFLSKHRRAYQDDYCINCGYAKGPKMNRSIQCPECGHEW